MYKEINNNYYFTNEIKKNIYDKEKFKEIIGYLKLKEYSKYHILDILSVSEHSLKKYLNMSKLESNYKYPLPHYIKKLLSFYFKLEKNFWTDTKEDREIEYYSPIDKDKNINTNILNNTDIKCLLGDHFFYTYNSNEGTIYSDKIRFNKNLTFKYKADSKSRFIYKGITYINSSIITLVADTFTIVFGSLNIDIHNKIIRGIINITFSKTQTVETKRFIFSRNKLENKKKVEYLGVFSNHSFSIIP